MPGDIHAGSLVDEDSVLSAQLVGKDLLILGRFEGSVEISGVFRVGKGGYARARVRSKQVEIEGTFEGEVATGLLVLGETAKAQGLFQVGRLRVYDGAVLNGAVKPAGAQQVTPQEGPSLPLSEAVKVEKAQEDDLERWEGEGGPPRPVR